MSALRGDLRRASRLCVEAWQSSPGPYHRLQPTLDLVEGVGLHPTTANSHRHAQGKRARALVPLVECGRDVSVPMFSFSRRRTRLACSGTRSVLRRIPDSRYYAFNAPFWSGLTGGSSRRCRLTPPELVNAATSMNSDEDDTITSHPSECYMVRVRCTEFSMLKR